MKKIIAIFTVFAALASLSACKVNNKELTPDEVQQSVAAEQSKRVEESLQAERDYLEGIDEQVEEEIGKTKKKERLVVKATSITGTEYIVFECKKDGTVKKKLGYLFYDNIENYKMLLESGGGSSRKIVDNDDKARMIVFSYDEQIQSDFDGLYKTYSSELSAEKGYTVIE